jgi:ribonuclease P protein subunit RPR2
LPSRYASRSRQRKIALRRISRLLVLARGELDGKPERSVRYVQLARRIATRCKVRAPRPLTRDVCKRCDTFLVPGNTCTVRLRRSRLNVTCRKCGMVYRIPYRKDVT